MIDQTTSIWGKQKRRRSDTRQIATCSGANTEAIAARYEFLWMVNSVELHDKEWL